MMKIVKLGMVFLLLLFGVQNTLYAKKNGNDDGMRQKRPKVVKRINQMPSVAYVIMKENGEIIKSSREESIKPIASITKLMLAWVLLKQKINLNEWVQIIEDDVDKIKKTSSKLTVGSVWTKGDLLKIALVASDNRAAHALARTSFGGVDSTVRKMNEEARSQKWASMIFVEPTGLSQENKSNTLDLMKLGLMALNKEEIKEIHEAARTEEMKINGIQFKNTNGWIRSGKINAVVSKTGFTNEAGRCIQLWMQKGSSKIGVGVLGAQSIQHRDKIIEEAFLLKK